MKKKKKTCHLGISFCWQLGCKLVWIWMGRRDLRHMLAFQWRETKQTHCRAADSLSHWAPLLSRVIYIRGDSGCNCACVSVCQRQKLCYRPWSCHGWASVGSTILTGDVNSPLSVTRLGAICQWLTSHYFLFILCLHRLLQLFQPVGGWQDDVRGKNAQHCLGE